ncbi:2-polyprenyl-6-methoxyphenol hydroxylase [Variovorax sp. HW608]|uniref:FAD-dependent monooxygenase n=1 Tax=Variovorax sp. HW608 TaxID=1034889 RepID=UPI00081F7B82|nr:FAD-dependent monooxygenase [Variovorax sp. HW608]SCK55145.1 2-polyprenyl-6-methoxyphenol hydroxylase [Variovorax sp. HW608]
MKCRILIVGGGIAGLTLALALQVRGIKSFTILERSKSLRQAGSGINVLPLASKELAELGLLDALEPLSVQLARLNYATWDGLLIWSEPKGRSAGFASPQLSISRSHLHRTLFQAVVERCGEAVWVEDTTVTGIRRRSGELLALCADGKAFSADLIVGADGIRSAVRQALFPDLAPLRVVPTTVYRGSLWSDALLDNRTMYIAGDGTCKFVIYPMFVNEREGRTHVNWAASIPDLAQSHHPLGNWNIPASPREISRKFKDWSLKGIHPERAICASEDAYAYPLVDIDPLPTWSNGADIALIGDAAHGMYPIGSNGATQSIVDAVALAQYLAISDRWSTALAAFEKDRMPTVQAIQRANRRSGPEVVVDIAADRRQRNETPLDIAFPCEERLEIVLEYANLTSVTQAIVNKTSPYKWIKE